MYNIHSHYENLISFIKTIIPNFRLVYLHPFGTSNVENMEQHHTGVDGPTFLCYDQEPLILEHNKNLFDYINEHKFKEQSIVLLNTEKDSEEKNTILNKYGFVDCYYFFHIFAAADWYRGSQYYYNFTPISSRKINKKYITFNRLTGNARVYRSYFVSELSKLNLLDKGHVSYSEVCPEHGHYQQNIIQSISKYNVPESYALNTIDELNTKVKFPLRIDSSTETQIPNKSFVLSAIPEMMESFLHVVTETCFWENKKHLTEKIFKPIVAKQPFVLLGCAHNLQYLREYGFKTFNHWWDESYDSIENPIERMHAVVKIVDKICSMTDKELFMLLLDMQEVLEHNYNLFYSQQFINNAWNELKNNIIKSIVQLPPETFEEMPHHNQTGTLYRKIHGLSPIDI
jgi:hypothetical protein